MILCYPLLIKIGESNNVKFYMKTSLMILLSCFCGLTAVAQTRGAKTASPEKNKKIQVVEAACGQCKLGLPGKNCDLAVRINGQSYFVDGTNIDSHGDAHAANGFCNRTRMAEVQGEIRGNRFKASYFKLLPDTSKTQEKIN